MKKIMIFLVIGLASISAFAQSTSEAPIQNISTDSTVVYRLFSTRNMYTFIKLNHCRPIKTDFDSSLLLTGLLSVVSFYNFSIFKSKPP
jgi:hypothetical protein